MVTFAEPLEQLARLLRINRLSKVSTIRVRFRVSANISVQNVAVLQ